jgi:predicted transcriptional regulator
MMKPEASHLGALHLHVRRIVSGTGQDTLDQRCDLDRRLPVGRGPSARLQLELERTPVTAVMSRDVICAAPDLALDALAAVLDAQAISGMPVVDAVGRPLGVVSRTDLVAARRPGASPTRVEDIMMPMTFSVPDHASLAHAIAIMACEGVHRIPVVGADRTVVGIVTTLDVVRWLAAEDAGGES